MLNYLNISNVIFNETIKHKYFIKISIVNNKNHDRKTHDIYFKQCIFLQSNYITFEQFDSFKFIINRLLIIVQRDVFFQNLYKEMKF